MQGQHFTLCLSSYRGNEKNTIYPYKAVISSVEDMERAAAYDHVCAVYQNDHRSIDDFQRADCLPFDLDNTHSDDPAEWKTLDDVRAAFPHIPFYAVESRNHIKPKGGKAARPKYHLYFPIEAMTDAGQYKRLKAWVIAAFPFLDVGAADVARFFYGVENPQVQFSPGTVTMENYLPWSGIAPPEDAATTAPQGDGESRSRFSLPDVIPSGERNSTLHAYAFRLYMLGLDPGEVLSLTEKANEERCEDALEREEVYTLVRSACRNERDRQAHIDRIEAVIAFSEAAQEQQKDKAASSVICLADVQERAPEWLIEGYIPRGEITVMAGDGGVGKTFAWCGIAAAISSGNKPFLLNNTFVDGAGQEPQRVMYFSSEDSNEAVLRPRLRASGAALDNIITIDSAHEDFQKVKLNSAYLENLIATYRPALVVFDPLQSFLPPRADMAARNQMREAMARLHVYGEKYGATFLIIMHTNKQQKVWGRTRLADSADIWDISRSVLIVGTTGEKGSTTRYLSQEKSSYGRNMQTVLFRIDVDTATFVGYTDKRDREFVRAASKSGSETPERDAAERFILEYLEENGETPIKVLDSAAAGNFISPATLRRAKERLREQKKITSQMKGSGRGKSGEWFASLLHPLS